MLQIVGTMNRAGAETMLMNLYRHMDTAAWQFDFVYFMREPCDYDAEIIQRGGHIYRIAPNRKYVPLALQWYRLRQLYRLLKHGRHYAAVHAHTLNSIGCCLLAANLAGISRRIAHAHSTRDGKGNSWRRRLYHHIAQWLIRINATELVACGRDAGIYLFGRRLAGTATILPNAVDVAAFAKDRSACKTRLCAELGLSADTRIIIGQVGRFQPVKNHAFTLRLAQHFREQGIRAHFVFAGTGPLQEQIKHAAQQAGVAAGISFLGDREDIADLVNAIDVLLMPSLYEGLPLTLVEAQAAGTPCVVSARISREADLGLGLVRFLDLEAPEAGWTDALLAAAAAAQVPASDRMATFRRKGYDIGSGVRTLNHIYENNPAV